MRCKFRVNLGSVDAARIGVDFRACVVGSEADVDDKTGKWLVTSGIAEDVTPPAPEPVVELKAVPVVEIESAAQPTEENTAPAEKPKKK